MVGLDCPCIPVMQCFWVLCYVIKGAEVNCWKGTITVLSACMLLAYVITVCLKMADLPKSFCSGFLCFPLPEAWVGMPLALVG